MLVYRAVSESVALDVDPGIDDALAIMLALRSAEVRLELIATVAGNGPLDMTTRNALRVLHYMGADHIAVIAGADCPLAAPFHGALGYHGSDALGNVCIEDCRLTPGDAPAHEALYRFAADAPGTRTLIATGPLTNVALAFEAHPAMPEMLRELVIMGGAFHLTPWGTGNETPYAEFNIWQDPEAADIVFSSSGRISVVGLDVSNDPATALTPTDVAVLRGAGSAAGRLAAELAGFACQRHDVCQLHDPLAVAIALQPALFDFAHGHVTVRADDSTYRGMTEFAADERGHVRVAQGVNAVAFKRLFLERMSER